MSIEMPDPIYNDVIAPGRAYLRLVEAANFLLNHNPTEEERQLLLRLCGVYTRKLREIAGTFPTDVTSEIWVASDKMIGAADNFVQN